MTFLVLAQISLWLQFTIVLISELSNRFRDCTWHISLRLFLMLSYLGVISSISAIHDFHVIGQFCIFLLTIVSFIILRNKILTRQLKVNGYKFFRKLVKSKNFKE